MAHYVLSHMMQMLCTFLWFVYLLVCVWWFVFCRVSLPKGGVVVFIAPLHIC